MTQKQSFYLTWTERRFKNGTDFNTTQNGSKTRNKIQLKNFNQKSFSSNENVLVFSECEFENDCEFF